MSLKIVTWNINSVRLRIGQVTRLLELWQPDVLCLQETKCPQGQFPSAPLKEMGYTHIAEAGQKGYHGVAIVSRIPFAGQDVRQFCAKDDCRHIAVSLAMPKPVTIHNLYVPAGGDEPDPEINPRFAHKLDFLERMTRYFEGRAKEDVPMVLVGDFNIAPHEHDVWSHKQLLKVVSHTPVETEGLIAMRDAGNFLDVARELVPEDEKLYTWWSYRSRDYRESNRGRRLDHIWVSPALKEAALSNGRGAFTIWDAERGREKPSDHVPVTLTLRL